LTNAAAIIAVDKTEEDKSSFQDTYRQVRAVSASLLPICDELVKSQRKGFGEFLGETQNTLADHQRLLEVTSALIVGLAVALGVQVYRGMIAPLRISLKESKNIIERQEKLASLGVLASGVAHEIRNPLTAIKFRLFTLKKTIPAVTQDEDAIIIGNEISRLERIVKDFLLFARPSEPKLARLSAVDILKDVHRLLRPQLEGSAIHLQVRASNGAYIHADQEQIKQVLINLIQNSAENIGRNGSVTLSLRHETMELGGRERSAVVIAVEDTGKGIAPEVEARLFDPFFSTKEGGTGLGLPISSRIIEKHGGILRYETKLNHGTAFEIVMPEVQDDATEDSTDRG
jgi:signal transduction histidine kinase